MFLFFVLVPSSTRRQGEPARGQGGSRPAGVSCHSRSSSSQRRACGRCQARAAPPTGLGSRPGRGNRRSAQEPGASPGAAASRPQQGPQPPRREVQRGVLLMSPSTGPLHPAPPFPPITVHSFQQPIVTISIWDGGSPSSPLRQTRRPCLLTLCLE